MKRNFRKLSALLLALVFSMNTVAFADDTKPMVTYNGVENEEFSFDVEDNATSTDLFGKFKGVMPGDHLEDQIKIVNTYSGSTGVKLYMSAELHNDADNKLTEEVEERIKGETYEEKLAYMNDFLSQLTMTVKANDANGNEITVYEGAPNELENGFEGDPVLLGILYKDYSVTLNVTLDVPFELSNEYAGAIGEVDWVFLIEQFNSGSSSGGSGSGDGDDSSDPSEPGDQENPDNPPSEEPSTDPSEDEEDEDGMVLGAVDENTNEDGEVLGAVDEEDEQILGITDAPKTGDDTVILPYIALFAFGLIGTILTAVGKRRKREE